MIEKLKVKERNIFIKFEGIDDWNRPVYREVDTLARYGSVNRLFPDKKIAPNNTIEEINDYFRKNMKELEFFGHSFNCEPHGGLSDNHTLIIKD